jgi:hypothetical protein
MTAPRFTFLLASVALAMAATFSSAAAGDEQTPVEIWNADRTTVFDGRDIDLEAFRWIARPVVVFADTPADPAFQRQLDLLQDGMDMLVIRDVVLITDTSRSDLSDVRRKLRPRGFMLTLIGKDGGVKLRKPFPWHVRELTRSIDKMPLRQQEIRDSATSE